MKFVNCTLENDFKITPEQLEASVSSKTKLFIYSSPCNPTGSVYSREELAGLAEVFKRHPQIAIISDEIYEFINFKAHHESIAQFSEIKDRVIVVNGMSKGFAMTGWRLGYMAGPRSIIQACEKLQGQCTSGANSIAQKAAITALVGDLGPTYKMVDAFRQRRDYVIGALKKIPGININMPEGAFYAFPDISSFFGKKFGDATIANDEDLSMFLLNEGSHKRLTVFCVPAQFPTATCISHSLSPFIYAANLMEAMERITAALKKLGT